jgi:hypothetical protein
MVARFDSRDLAFFDLRLERQPRRIFIDGDGQCRTPLDDALGPLHHLSLEVGFDCAVLPTDHVGRVA